MFVKRRFVKTIIGFFISFFILTILMNFRFKKYSINEFKEVYYHYLEIGLVGVFMFILIPSNIPPIFTVMDEDQMKLFSRIYIAKLKAGHILAQRDVIYIYKNKKIPFIILNPGYFFDTFISFTKIKLGFIDNEKKLLKI